MGEDQARKFFFFFFFFFFLAAQATADRSAAARSRSVALAVDERREQTPAGNPLLALPLALAAANGLPNPPDQAQGVLADLAYAQGERECWPGAAANV